MSRKCSITGKGPQFGHNVSHSHKKTLKKWSANIISKRVWLPEEKRFVRLKISAKTLRTIKKRGLQATLRNWGLTLAKVGR
jgi:large subunit ribosomal protein L28